MSISQAQASVQSFNPLFSTGCMGYSSNSSVQLISSTNGAFFDPKEVVHGQLLPFETPLSGHMMPTFPVVRVGNLWLPRESLTDIECFSASQSPLSMARHAVTRGIEQMKAYHPQKLTQHAMLIAFGEYAQQIGLIDKLKAIEIPAKGVVHAPQAKVLTFLMGVLTGITHLKDLNEGPHPIAHDFLAIRAWGLVALPHYSGVSRTLAACDSKTVAAITEALDSIVSPFISKEVCLIREQNQPLIVDFDLAPRRVSNTSTSFPDAQFGWQGCQVGLGYDAALVALTSPTYGRLFVTGFHYPRNPIGLPRTQQMVRAMEARLGVHPQRRTVLVKRRIHTLEKQMTQLRQWMATQLSKQQALFKQSQTLGATLAQLRVEIEALEAKNRQTRRVEKPNGQLAKVRRRYQAAGKKLMKLPQALRQTQQAQTTHQQRLETLVAQHTQLVEHFEQLQKDNQNNTDPAPIILRMDAGFGTDANITWLIEMGYHIYTKAHNSKVASKLKAMVPKETSFTRVGKNAEMIGFDDQSLHNCPYLLTMALERFHTPDGLKHSTLIVYRDDQQTKTLSQWFGFYNGRQLIEAGIKEGNVVFKMHPLKMRSSGGIALQEQFSLFAANFVRLAAVWLKDRVQDGRNRFSKALGQVKTMVRVVANTCAWVIRSAEHLVIRFDETSAYPRAEIHLKGTWQVHPPLLPKTPVSKTEVPNDFPVGCT